MTPRERLIRSFSFEEVRPVPYTIWYDHETMEKLNAYYGGGEWQESIQDHILRLIVDWEPRDWIDSLHYRDVHGSVWRAGETPRIVRPALEEPSLEGFSIADYVPYLRAGETPSSTRHEPLPRVGFADAASYIERERKHKFVIVHYGFGLLECSWMIRGYENLFVDLLQNPSFCHGLYDMLLERHLRLVDALLELPCDGIIFADDYGDQRGVIIGPVLWRRFIRPRLAKLYDRVRRRGKWTFHHSCGNVSDIIPDLIEIGLDVLQCLQPEVQPVYKIKEQYGRDLRLWGGFGTQGTLPLGSPDEIRSEARRLRQVMGAGGGYCFSSSKPILKDVPAANAAAFIEETLSCEF